VLYQKNADNQGVFLRSAVSSRSALAKGLYVYQQGESGGAWIVATQGGWDWKAGVALNVVGAWRRRQSSLIGGAFPGFCAFFAPFLAVFGAIIITGVLTVVVAQ